MTCGGCEAAVRRSLGKLEGEPVNPTPEALERTNLCFLLARAVLRFSHDILLVRMSHMSAQRAQSLQPCSAGVQSVDVDLPTQKVLVKGNVTPEAVVQQVSKTGKPTELWK